MMESFGRMKKIATLTMTLNALIIIVLIVPVRIANLQLLLQIMRRNNDVKEH